jgi:hypothetical protein
MKRPLKDAALLLGSITIIYFLAPSLDHSKAVLISAIFAIVNILSSKPIWERSQSLKYLIYVAVAIGTYYVLFNDEPWNMLFKGGLFESSPWPLIICSLLMTANGWLLFSNWKQRRLYALITLGIQVPVAILVGGDFLQATFTSAADVFKFTEQYSGSWQVWQFEWMLTYYLPIFALSRINRQ